MRKTPDSDLPYTRLERCIHEPARLAILSLLINSGEGLSYAELRERLDLTYGNLERHMRVLIENQVVTVEKVATRGRSQSIAHFSESGRENFLQYLDDLEKILLSAQGRYREDASREPDGLIGDSAPA